MPRAVIESNAQEFVADVGEMFDSLVPALQSVVQSSIMDLCLRIVQTTPVDTGFLRGSWQPSLDGEPDAIEGSTGSPLPNISAVVAGLKLGDTFWLVNGAKYAMRIEYGFVGEDSLGRHYNQAGRFWVQTALALWEEIVHKHAEAALGHLHTVGAYGA